MAVDIFLKLGDGSKAKGESTDIKHKDEIELTSFDIGVSNPSSVGSSTTGSGSGKASFSPFKATSLVNKSFPVLFQMSASGDHFDKATVTVRKAGGKNPVEYLIYTFEQVYIDNLVNNGPTATADMPTQVMTFSYATVHVKYTPQKADGTGDSPVEGGWDLVQNQPK